jgi:outer membrane protein
MFGKLSKTAILVRAHLLAAMLSLGFLMGFAPSISAQPAFDSTPWIRPATNAFISEPLSLAEAVNLALRQNPDIRRAQADLETTEGIVIQTRAVAIPTVGIVGEYNIIDEGAIDTPPGLGFTFGSDQSWRTQIRLVQSIYEGGRILSGLRAARLQRQQAMLTYQTALMDTVLAVQVAYFDVLLAEQQITVRERSIELLNSELVDARRRFEAGTVPRFNVLRAEVELANEQPNLSRARNAFRIGKNNLSNLLGFTVPKEAVEDIPLHLADSLRAEPYDINLSQASSKALEYRTEIEALRTASALTRENIVTARAGYRPSVQGFVGYDAHSSMFSDDLTDTFHGWMAGVQLNWNIFDGLRTQGRIREARARHQRAEVEVEDAGRRIELEVRTAHSTFIEAREVLESTAKVVEQAEEALRLATARNQAGTGTQLDVLSARTALTQAQTTQNVALRDYSVARARLERAVGMNLPVRQ